MELRSQSQGTLDVRQKRFSARFFCSGRFDYRFPGSKLQQIAANCCHAPVPDHDVRWLAGAEASSPKKIDERALNDVEVNTVLLCSEAETEKHYVDKIDWQKVVSA